jgi:hypothetical protein
VDKILKISINYGDGNSTQSNYTYTQSNYIFEFQYKYAMSGFYNLNAELTEQKFNKAKLITVLPCNICA